MKNTAMYVKIIGAFAVAAGIVMVLAALLSSSGTLFYIEKPPSTNTNPLVGPVFFDNTNDKLYKVCDGTTLIYVIDTGGSAVANSPECRKTK